MNIISKRFGQP